MNGHRPSSGSPARPMPGQAGQTALVLFLAVFALTGAQVQGTGKEAPKTGPAPEQQQPAPAAQPPSAGPQPQTPAVPPAQPAAAPNPAPAGQSPVPGAGVPNASAAPAAPETVWLDDNLPAGAVAEGTWNWDSANFASGSRSHGHPPAPGIRWHGYRMAHPVTIPPGSMITQQVWLDPKNPPKGIALQFKLATGEEVGVYWEAEEEVFKPDETQELWYYGPLPELGKWTTLEVLSEDLGLENGQITGVRFVTYDGRVLWDRTALTAAPPIEKVQDLLQEPVEKPLKPVEKQPGNS